MTHLTNDTEEECSSGPALNAWLAFYCRYGKIEYSEHESKQQAEKSISIGEEAGECYGLAVYDLTKREFFHQDSLGVSDFKKVESECLALIAN